MDVQSKLEDRRLKLATIRTNNRTGVALITSDDASSIWPLLPKPRVGRRCSGTCSPSWNPATRGHALAAQLADGSDTMSLDDVTLCTPVPLIFPVANLVEYITSIVTLSPGDKVKIRITGIGELHNTVEASDV